MLSPISSLDRISILVQSSINLLLGTKSVKRLKMNKHAPHITRWLSALPTPDTQRSGAVHSECSARAFHGLRGHQRELSEPARRCWRDSSSGSGDGTGRDGTAPRAAPRPPPTPVLGRRATVRWQAGERDGQRKPKGWKVEHLVCCHPFSIQKSTSLLEALINRGGM